MQCNFVDSVALSSERMPRSTTAETSMAFGTPRRASMAARSSIVATLLAVVATAVASDVARNRDSWTCRISASSARLDSKTSGCDAT